MALFTVMQPCMVMEQEDVVGVELVMLGDVVGVGVAVGVEDVEGVGLAVDVEVVVGVEVREEVRERAPDDFCTPIFKPC